jgi:hypothetical protein
MSPEERDLLRVVAIAVLESLEADPVTGIGFDHHRHRERIKKALKNAAYAMKTKEEE